MTTHANKEWKPQVKAFWKRIHRDYDFEVETLEIFRTACDQYHRYLEAKEQIDADGLTIPSPMGLRKHPACEIEKIAFKNFMAALKLLGINKGEEKLRPGRPSTLAAIGG